MEPVCLGAGGMVFVDPLFQKILVDVVRSSSDLFGSTKLTASSDSSSQSRLSSADEAGEWQGLPVIYDEGVSSHSPSG
jgi:dethiobiotin synthetase/adenosylmethionine--8-amino-7-oxononanoate aminotransferase